VKVLTPPIEKSVSSERYRVGGEDPAAAKSEEDRKVPSPQGGKGETGGGADSVQVKC